MWGLQLYPMLISIVVCLTMAAAGNIWVGDALRTWYPQLTKPRIQVPLWTFATVGAAVYVAEGVVLYRLLALSDSWQAQIAGVAALLVVMVYNEDWNLAFFAMRSPFAALVGVVAYIAPLTVLMVALAVFDPVSAWLLAPYCVWVGYDIAWLYELTRLNPSPRG